MRAASLGVRRDRVGIGEDLFAMLYLGSRSMGVPKEQLGPRNLRTAKLGNREIRDREIGRRTVDAHFPPL
jgi:hypothetical protein